MAVGICRPEDSVSNWIMRPGMAQPTGNDFEQRSVALEEFLKKRGVLDPDSYYLRGDFFGDRTLFVIVNDAAACTERLMRTFQEWLEGNSDWRVALVLGTTPAESIVVYASEIVRGSKAVV